MTFQLTILTVFASISSAIAAISLGTYRIINVQTRTSLQNYLVNKPIVVGQTPTKHLFEQWNISPIPKSPPNFYSLQNLGSQGFAGLTTARLGDPVSTTPYAQVFNITMINESYYVVKSSGADLAWSIDSLSPVVKLQIPCSEQQSQQWIFERLLL